MKHDILGHTEAARSPRVGEGQVHLSRQSVREPVVCDSRLMREHSCLFGPEPHGHEVLVLARRKVHEAVDASTHTKYALACHVVHEELGRIACLGRLLRRE